MADYAAKRNSDRCPTHPGALLKDDILPALGLPKAQVAHALARPANRGRRHHDGRRAIGPHRGPDRVRHGVINRAAQVLTQRASRAHARAVGHVVAGGARVSAGDYVVAARSREGLAAQMGGQPSPQAVVVTLDVRDGPVSLGLSRAVARDLSRRGAGRDSSGRRSPYGGGGW